MDQNNATNNLNRLFQEVTLTSVNENNIMEIENLLISIIDNNNYSFFNNPIFINFIFLLDNIDNTSLVVKHLIKEIKLKSLRLLYTDCNKVEDVCCEEEVEKLPVLTGLPSYPQKGKTGIARTREDNGDFVVIKTYKIDHTGQAIELVKIEKEDKRNEIKILNDSMIERALNEYNGSVPLTEDDL